MAEFADLLLFISCGQAGEGGKSWTFAAHRIVVLANMYWTGTKCRGCVNALSELSTSINSMN